MHKNSSTYITFHNLIQHLAETGDSILDRNKASISRMGVVYEYRNQTKDINKDLYYLRRMGFLLQEGDGEASRLIFTEKARVQVLLQRIESEKRVIPGGKCCFVTFDMPVTHNDVRDKWRRYIKLWGFKKVHASLWYTDKTVLRDLRRLIKILKVGEYVKIVVGRLL